MQVLYDSQPRPMALSSSDDEDQIPTSSPVEFGPDPAELVITEKSLLSANGQELNKLRHQLMKANTENKELNRSLKIHKQKNKQ